MPIEELKRATRIDEERIQKLKELFPEAFSEGKLNLRVLKEEIFDSNDEEQEEHYSLQWIGKRNARKLAYIPSDGTLKLSKEQGINENDTGNIVIEGDNLEVLRLLQKSYANKVDLIYIDPPYNTGNDFIYKDDFRESISKYLLKSGQADGEGVLTSNPKSGGRYHANWLNMIYPRLKLARNLLSEDGLIFVSIDDNELANLKLVLDEVFGEDNFITNIVWKHTQQSKNDEPYFSRHHNSILVYRKSDKLGKIRVERTESDNKAYSNPDNDPKGLWRSGDVRSPSLRNTLKYEIKTPSGKVIQPPDNGWRWAKKTLEQKIGTGEIIFSQDETKIIRKIYLADQEGRTPENVLLPDLVGTTREATSELKELFGISPFDTPKPTRLIKWLIKLVKKKDALILDFFAGSGTTGQAVMEANTEDGGNRKFMLIQIPEPIETDEFSTIADITKERIRRVISKLNELDNNSLQLDRGFKVYQLDESNFRKWTGSQSDDIKQLEDNLDLFTIDHFVEGYNDEDVVVELLLNQGFPLNSSISRGQDLKENVLWTIHSDVIPFNMYICLDKNLYSSTVEFLARKEDRDVLICLDDSLSNEAKVVLSETMKVKTI
jgi:adenine-specific DNA-methyltransferase